MSADSIYKNLQLIDPESYKKLLGKKGKKVKNVFDLMTDKEKLTKKVIRRGKKAQTIGLVSKQKTLTVVEAKRTLKSKDEILKSNLKKLEQIREACKLKLDKSVTEEIIERAVTRRPVKPKSKLKKSEKTAFTEEDFKKFEAEYFG